MYKAQDKKAISMKAQKENIISWNQLNSIQAKYKSLDEFSTKQLFHIGSNIAKQKYPTTRNHKADGFQFVQIFGKLHIFEDLVIQIKDPVLSQQQDYQSLLLSQKSLQSYQSFPKIKEETKSLSQLKLSPHPKSIFNIHYNDKSTQSTQFLQDDEFIQNQLKSSSNQINLQQKKKSQPKITKFDADFYKLAQQRFVSLNITEEKKKKITRTDFLKKMLSDYSTLKKARCHKFQCQKSPLEYIQKQILQLKINS